MNLFVLDTDHVSLILRGDRRIIDRLQSLDKNQWAATIISMQEVFNGWIVKLNDPWNFDSAAESCYDRLLATHPDLRKRRIEKDVKIAAIALANQGTIVTRNQRDFMLVPDLRLENWAIDVS